MKLGQVSASIFDFCHISLESRVLVAVSGGPDSLCLLDSLSSLPLSLLVAHFDHQLRESSGHDARFVRQQAQSRNLPFLLGSADVAAYARENRLSVEEAARVLRYRFLFSQARQYGVQAVAVGHNADDQVETLLMHLLRGAGLEGLAGMPYRAVLPEWDPAIPLVRPLLPFSRQEILAYCRERGLQPVVDESNQDTSFFRNRIRHDLLPVLESYNPQVRQALWRTASLLQGDAAVMEMAVQSAWTDCVLEQAPQYITLRLEELKRMIPGLARGVLRQALSQLLPHLRDVDFAVIERAMHYANHPPGGPVDLLHGLVLFQETAPAGLLRLVIARAESLPLDAAWPQLSTEREQALSVPGAVQLSSGWELTAEWVNLEDPSAQLPNWQDLPNHQLEAWIDAAALPGPLAVRCPQPGDRFQPLGMQRGSIKLSDFWINEKLPRRARAGWPIVTAGEEIIWIPGYRLAHSYRLTGITHRVLKLRLVRQEGS